jgi:uncharacterized protein YbbC (DUF1343 family)
MKRITALILLMFTLPLVAAHGQNHVPAYDEDVQAGAMQITVWTAMLQGKKVALVGNQTSLVGQVHLLDTMLSLGISVTRVFALEHGFRGTADAGAVIKDGKDSKTGIAVVSLYGSSKKPTAEQLKGVDVVVFDLQDVGARFYTYISSMHYIMEACAENKVPFVVFDRPNPNGHYVDGPVLDMRYKSFIGMHPVPVVHGLTIGEYAQMINGEGWLAGGVKAPLQVVPCTGYTHKSFFRVPVKPSPNLPNMASIYLYPTLCLFEGTAMSVGRGTDLPFQFIGAPGFTAGNAERTPQSTTGATKPKYMGQSCKGYNLQAFGEETMPHLGQLYIYWLVGAYRDYPRKDEFFKSEGSFNHLAGNSTLKELIIAGKTAEEIAQTWKDEVDAFKLIRKKYLLYPDFE